jgi:hypothetical protein
MAIRSRTSLVRWIVLAVLVVGCARFLASDPRAAGPNADRWETTIPRARVAVFNAAVDVLRDSGYVLAQENTGVSAISTADRRTRSNARPGLPLDSLGRSDYPVRLSLVLTPRGGDSTYLSITGQYRTGANAGRLVAATSSDWRLVRGIGEAILARVK